MIIILSFFAAASALGGAPPGATPGQSSAIADRPPARATIICHEGNFANFAGPFQQVRLRPGGAVFRIDGEDPCLEDANLACTEPTALASGDRWLAGASRGDWLCVSDGTAFGWTRRSQVDLVPVESPSLAAWIGRWRDPRADEDDDAGIRIRRAQHGRTLKVTGQAYWRSGPDAEPHIGFLDFTAAPAGVTLDLGPPECLRLGQADEREECSDCVARLLLVNGRLLAYDNGGCGGMNVNFWGVYDRIGPLTYPDVGQEREAQVGVWEWTGSEAVPQLVKSYWATYESHHVERDGDLVRIATKEQTEAFFTCGSCAMTEHTKGTWTLRITPDGVSDLGHVFEQPLLQAADTLLSRVARGQDASSIAAPEVVARLNQFIERERRSNDIEHPPRKEDSKERGLETANPLDAIPSMLEYWNVETRGARRVLDLLTDNWRLVFTFEKRGGADYVVVVDSLKPE